MRRHSLGVAALAVSLGSASAAACSSVYSEAVDPAADGGGAEAGDALGPDAPSSDTGPAGDGGNLDAASLRFCEAIDASALVFCTDFEGIVAPPNFGWDSVLKSNVVDASVSVDPGAGLGGTRGLTVETDIGGSATVWVVKIVASGDPGQFGHYEAEFDFIDVASPIAYVGLGILEFPGGGANRENGVATYNNGATISTLAPQGPSIGDGHVWHHARLLLQRPPAGSGFARTLFLDGMSINAGSQITASSGGVELRLGTFYTATGMGIVRVRFDNVVVRRW